MDFFKNSYSFHMKPIALDKSTPCNEIFSPADVSYFVSTGMYLIHALDMQVSSCHVA